jgi:hypothetical protein
MGFLDKVKEKATQAVDAGKDVAQHQQLKMGLHKLEKNEEEALAAFGNAAFSLWEAGTLSMSSDLAAAAERIREVRGQIEAKRAEISAVGADPDEADEPEPAETASTPS